MLIDPGEPIPPAASRIHGIDDTKVAGAPRFAVAWNEISTVLGDSILIGPDNGLLSWGIAALGEASRAVQLTNGDLWLHSVSATFHGRDIFMPVAAHLADGIELEQAGAIGKLHETVYSTVGVATTLAHSARMGREIAEKLREAGVDAVILTST